MSKANDCAIPKAGEFSWNELVTKNSKVAAKFYSGLFGWKPTAFKPKGSPAGAPPYTIFQNGGDKMGAGGMVQVDHPDAPTQWVPYVVVADVDKSLAKAVKLGAQICLPVMSIGEVGRIAVLVDPQGARIGLHELPKK